MQEPFTNNQFHSDSSFQAYESPRFPELSQENQEQSPRNENPKGNPLEKPEIALEGASVSPKNIDEAAKARAFRQNQVS